jgi:DNA processing protein
MSLPSYPELQYQIALTMAPAIGPVNARKLIDKAGSASEVFRMNRASMEKIEGIGPFLSQSIRLPMLMSKAENELKFIEQHNIKALFFKDIDYPARLKECQDAPILLYAKGSEELNRKRVLSVVGTRKASAYGRDLCRRIVLDLGSRISDLVIVSGLAYGIDVIAHRAALDGGIPTVAVLGHGLHTMYPRAHRETAIKICGQGALVSDFHSGMGPERNNFLRRNRIIAGMADATLVVESASSGGALITADMAFSYHRNVLAVPGRATDDRSLGCNRLIKLNMAALVESAEDVISHLMWTEEEDHEKKQVSGQASITKEERTLLELMVLHGGLGPGELSGLSDIPIQEVLSVLTQMELKGWIRMEPGNLFHNMINLS